MTSGASLPSSARRGAPYACPAVSSPFLAPASLPPLPSTPLLLAAVLHMDRTRSTDAASCTASPCTTSTRSLYAFRINVGPKPMMDVSASASGPASDSNRNECPYLRDMLL